MEFWTALALSEVRFVRSSKFKALGSKLGPQRANFEP